MPINSRRKRQNAAQVGAPLPVSVLPSLIDAFARAQISWTYAGIAIAPPAATTPIEDRIMGGSQNTIAAREVTIGDYN
jgi:hypothetical protein